jgi:Uma2 family endonuclease
MTSTTTRSQVVDEQAEPAWEIATLFPAQGTWSEEDYLLLPTNHLVEFSHGRVEVLPMPTQSHQLIVLFLYRVLYEFVTARRLGTLLIAPLRVRLWPGKFREPDLVFMLAEHADRRHDAYWGGADLVMEVVSPDDPQRDLVTKRQEYAQAGIPEYWVVDPQAETITVLRLDHDQYVEHGQFGRGMVATSALLEGFEVEVDGVLREV